MSLPIVETKQGKLMGRKCEDHEGNDYFSFQGIPYAKPPLGDLRFKAPVSAEGWKGVRMATECGPRSLQIDSDQNVIGSEDCLYLNVYTPRLPCCAKCRLPVLVYIHGGSFLFGTGNDDYAGPEFLLTEMTVLVTFNYRLGLLGFLAMQDQSLEIGGNTAFKDCVQCLKWVQQNITDFNGDPKNVTIFGNSAGAVAVHCLILSPAATGLFHKAIMQSGSAFCPWAMCKNNIGYEAAKAIGYSGSETDDKAILDFLIKADEQQIIKAQMSVDDNLMPSGTRGYGPIVEYKSPSAFLTEPPLYIIASDSYNKVPIIIGYTDREGMILETYLKFRGEKLQLPLDYQNFIPAYYNIKRDTPLSSRVADMMKNYYCGPGDQCDENNVDNVYLMETDIMFWRGIYLTIKSHATSVPMYLYRFAADGELNLAKIEAGVNSPGACHGDDFHHLFKQSNTPCIDTKSQEYKTVQRMVKLWTTFARYGDPTMDKSSSLITVKWEPVTTTCMKSLNITNDSLSFEPNPDIERMEVWDKISEYIAQSHQ